MAGDQRYDVVVIGSGPGGERGASTAAYFGKRVAVVERHRVLGGASTNTGTIPSKTLRETSLALSGLRMRKLYGVDLSLRREATIQDFMYSEQHVKSSEQARVKTHLERSGIDIYHGTGSFKDAHTVLVQDGASETLLEADVVLIATGSAPMHPPGFPFEHPLVHDSDEILTLECLPKSLGVVGAGVIGSEYACTFAALGVDVHILDGRSVLLPFLDAEVSKALEAAMVRLGITFHWGETVEECRVADPAGPMLRCRSGKELALGGVLVAAGRTSNTEVLNLGPVGVEVGERGLLKVDVHYRTNIPNIYAVGDVIGFPALAATSAEQGRVAMCHACGQPAFAVATPLLPTGIYTIPEVSMVGETEESLKKQGVEYVVGKAYARDNARGKIIGDDEGFLKLLFREGDMKLLGAHTMGERACEIIHIALVAMVGGHGAQLLFETCFNYPTLGDMYKAATYQAVGRANRHKIGVEIE